MSATHGQQPSHGSHGSHAAPSAHDMEAAHQVDSWHHHDSVEGEPQGEHLANVNPLLVGKWFFISGAIVAATVASLWIYFDHYTAQLATRRQEVYLGTEFLTRRAGDETVLGLGAGEASRDAAFVGISGKKVQLPIDTAMDKVVARAAVQKTVLTPARGMTDVQAAKPIQAKEPASK